MERRQTVGRLLHGSDLGLVEIAKQVGLTRERVRQIQSRYFPDCPRPKPRKLAPPLSPYRFQKKVIQWLRSSGDTWCYECRQVKCLEEFSPRTQQGQNGLMCTLCNSRRQRKLYRGSPKLRDYMREYHRSHPEQSAEAHRRWWNKKFKTSQSGYKLALLEEWAPAHAQAVRDGEITLAAAFQKIRLLKKRSIRLKLSVTGFKRAAWRWLTEEERQELKQEL